MISEAHLHQSFKEVLEALAREPNKRFYPTSKVFDKYNACREGRGWSRVENSWYCEVRNGELFISNHRIGVVGELIERDALTFTFTFAFAFALTFTFPFAFAFACGEVEDEEGNLLVVLPEEQDGWQQQCMTIAKELEFTKERLAEEKELHLQTRRLL